MILIQIGTQFMEKEKEFVIYKKESVKKCETKP